mgnify:CR=1 FL=1
MSPAVPAVAAAAAALTLVSPAVADMPLDLRVKLVENRKNPEDTVFHSKAVGEPPFMLGIAAWCALKDAVASLADYKVQPQIDAPATPERVLWGVEQMRKLRRRPRLQVLPRSSRPKT